MMTTHEFDALIKKSHDFLYANSSVKLPENLQAEMAKIVLVLTAEARGTISPRPLMADQEFEWFVQSYEDIRASRSEWDWGDIQIESEHVLWVFNALSSVDYSRIDRDFLGDALEVMRSTDAKRLGGQFFTDQRITELSLDLISYDATKHDLLDICAGTGGFLIPAIKRSAQVKKQQPILGIEIDSKISSLARSTLSHYGDVSSAKVHNADSLKNPNDWSIDLRKQIIPGTHLRLASNPPFGTKIKIRDKQILSQYDLARQWRYKNSTWQQLNNFADRAPEVLFVERNLQLAAPGEGICSLVLPYQILSGPQLGYVRYWLLLNAQIISVVDLSADTFQPWTGTKASLVTFRRRKKPINTLDEIKADPDIFMSVSEHIGHDRRGKPVVDSHGNILEDVSKIGLEWKQWELGNPVGQIHGGTFIIPASRLLDSDDLRLNAAYFKPSGTSVMKSFTELKKDSGFETRTISELVERIFCPGRFKRSYVDSDGVPFLGGSNITQFVLVSGKALSKDDPHLSDLVVEPGWILVTRSGSTGIVSRVPEAWKGFAISDHVIRIVPKDGELRIANYVETFLRSKWGQELLQMGIFGSVIDEITPEYIGSLPIPVPTDLKRLEKLSDATKKILEGRDMSASGLSDSQKEIDKLLNSILK